MLMRLKKQTKTENLMSVAIKTHSMQLFKDILLNQRSLHHFFVGAGDQKRSATITKS